jgi:hypothetical protein
LWRAVPPRCRLFDTAATAGIQETYGSVGGPGVAFRAYPRAARIEGCDSTLLPD